MAIRMDSQAVYRGSRIPRTGQIVFRAHFFASLNPVALWVWISLLSGNLPTISGVLKFQTCKSSRSIDA